MHLHSAEMVYWQQRLIALLVVATLPWCAPQAIYYVTPTHDIPCPGEPCHTLAEYVQHSEQYLTSNTQFVFLPGNHTLEKAVSVKDVTNITFQGNESSLPQTKSKIVCKWMTSFGFNNVSSLRFNSLDFISCGDGSSAAGIGLSSVNNSEISDCTFKKSFLPTASRVLELKHTRIELIGTSFISNSVSAGYVLYIMNSTVNITGAIFVNNTAHSEGTSVIYVEGSTLSINESKIFNNRAVYRSSLNNATRFSTLTLNKFTNFGAKGFRSNVLSSGSGIMVLSSRVYFSRNSFSTYHGGCSIYVGQSEVTFARNSFVNNTHSLHANILSVGGGVLISESNATFIGNEFVRNSAQAGGAVSVVYNSHVNFSGDRFVNNTATGEGGGVSVFESAVHFVENTFLGNRAARGGSIASVSSTIDVHHCNISNSSASVSGGAVFVENQDSMLAEERRICNFGIYTSEIENNTAQYGGGIFSLNCNLQITQNTVCKDNTADYGGCLSLISSTVNISTDSSVEYNRANLYGGGVYAAKSDLNFEQNSSFVANSAMLGGGLLLTADSYLYLSSLTTINFLSNSAVKTGGAIDIMQGNPVVHCDIESAIPISNCFFQIIRTSCNQIQYKIELLFEDNTATEGGGDIYGGSIDNCSVCNHRSTGSHVFNQITSNNTATLEVSSDPLYLYMCNVSTNKPVSVYPGGVLQLFVVARGQRNGSVSAVVRADQVQGSIEISELQTTQEIKKICTAVNYTIFGLPGTDEVFTVYTEGQCPQEQRSLFIRITILDCPPGFELSATKQSCVCDDRLLPYTEICTIDNQTLLRSGDFWVGYDNTTTFEGLILSSHCPFDYCIAESAFIKVDDSDEQCRNDRDGLLCGRCRKGFSIVFGSSHCVHCSNRYVLLLLAFAFAGIVLVVFLFVLKLTVASGTINGLIFYANVIQVYYSTFFPSGVTNTLSQFSTVFIAWLNLDLGIETCFYDGMDMYARTWLQFVFPIYVWALVGIIILVSRFSSGKIARMFGKNPIAVLATLFLLSYAKLLRTIITTLSVTYLEFSNGTNKAVWLYDGNLMYLRGKHMPLFAVSIIFFLFLFLPYTLLLLLGQWLQKLSWFNSHRVKPFLDAYYAPYTAEHCYWTGLLLLLRCFLFLIFATRGKTVNLLVISSVIVGIFSLVTLFTKAVYVNWYIWLLEASFLLNLGILSVGTFYSNFSGGNQAIVTFISVGTAFVTFTGIILYHVFLRIRGTNVWKTITRQNHPLSISSNEDYVTSDSPAVIPSSTSVCLREPLLEN